MPVLLLGVTPLPPGAKAEGPPSVADTGLGEGLFSLLYDGVSAPTWDPGVPSTRLACPLQPRWGFLLGPPQGAGEIIPLQQPRPPSRAGTRGGVSAGYQKAMKMATGQGKQGCVGSAPPCGQRL